MCAATKCGSATRRAVPPISKGASKSVVEVMRERLSVGAVEESERAQVDPDARAADSAAAGARARARSVVGAAARRSSGRRRLDGGRHFVVGAGGRAGVGGSRAD